MLSTVIDRLTSLGSKYFVVGAFIPVLVFAFFNAALLYVEFDWFHDWADPQISGASRAFDVAAVGVALAVVAFVLWTLKTFLSDLLAGRHLRPGTWLERRLTAGQLARARALRTRYAEARNAAVELTRRETEWTESLSAAATRGLATTQNGYDGRTGDAALRIATLRLARQQADDISVADLQHAVQAFVTALETNNIGLRHPTEGAVLADDRRDLITLVQYARNRWDQAEVALATDLQWRFGARDIAPTAFGNVAAALQSYGSTRYGINLPTFWSRLQAVLVKDAETIAAVQDARTQLDFLVCSCSLAVCTTAVWGVVLPVWGGSVGRFIAVMIAGPLVARLSYVAAVENYIAFAEVVRSTVDLHRFRLLDALNVRRPTSLRDERALWEALRRVTAFGQDAIDIGYTASPGAGTKNATA